MIGDDHFTFETDINTHQVCLVVSLWLCIWEVLGSNLGRDTNYSDSYSISLPVCRSTRFSGKTTQGIPTKAIPGGLQDCETSKLQPVLEKSAHK
jgi:hypothetical protein